MQINLTDIALLKVLKDNTTSNFPGLIKDFREITRVVERLNYSLFEAKYQQQEWEQCREALVAKFAGLNYSLLQLLEGSEVTDIFDVNKKSKILDISGIYLIVRSLIETYLTIYYLNFEFRDHTERQKFRNDLYKYSGLARRQEFKPKQQEGIAKLAFEAHELMGLKQAIEANPYYHTLTTDKKDKIWKKNIAREYSWFDMIQSRGLTSMDFLSMWKLLSNHAHAEYIGVMQLNSYYKNPEEYKPGIISFVKYGFNAFSTAHTRLHNYVSRSKNSL